MMVRSWEFLAVSRGIIEALSVHRVRRQKGLRCYRSFVDSEFSSHLEFLFHSVIRIAGMDEVDRNGLTFTQPLWPGKCLHMAREQ